jgi:hypothetical protein
MNKPTIIFLLASLCFLISCTVQLYKPHAENAVLQQELVNGRKLYVAHCGNCHNLYLPKTYSAVNWKKNLDEMAVKAKITDQQKQLILQYLVSQP